MKLSILESNKVMAEFSIERDSHMFKITPNIYNKKFDRLSHEIRIIRAKYMTRFLGFTDLDDSKAHILQIEMEIIDEIRSYVLRELSYFNNCEGCSYYIRIGD